MPLSVAWETFGEANGVDSNYDMMRHVATLRHTRGTDDSIGCVVLSERMLLDRAYWIAAPADWHPNIVRVAGHDLTSGEGARIWMQLQALAAVRGWPGAILSVPGASALQLVAARCGQGAFRLDGHGRIRTPLRDLR